MIEVVSQQSMAEARGRLRERARVRELLALAEGSVPQEILEAIADGVSLHDFDRSQRRKAADPQRGPIKPGTSAAGSGGSRWGAVVSKINARKRSKAEAVAAEDSAS